MLRIGVMVSEAVPICRPSWIIEKDSFLIARYGGFSKPGVYALERAQKHIIPPALFPERTLKPWRIR